MRQDEPDAAFGARSEGPTVEQPRCPPADNPTIRQKLEGAMRQGGAEHTAELAIDDLGLDLGALDTVDQPGMLGAVDAGRAHAGRGAR